MIEFLLRSELLSRSEALFKQAREAFNPTHIVSMVSGGKDSSASDAVARELGIKIDLVIHGNTRTGIRQTTEFCRERYGSLGDYIEADAGTAYESYVMRKGFFGVGRNAHNFSYRILKADPFRATISRMLRKRQRGVRVMLLNGARKDESENRRKHLKPMHVDPARPNNLWVNLIHDWSQAERDAYLESRKVPINPVAKAICRSGECMCGTMQSKCDRAEVALVFPEWGRWIDDLESIVRAKHGFGWGEQFPKKRNLLQCEFQPMCSDCMTIPT